MDPKHSPRSWDIDISIEVEALQEYEESLRLFLVGCLSELSDEPISESVSHVSILITNDAAVQELNATYRGKDRPTDVLSFSQLEGENMISDSLGDIVVSLDTAVRQANEFHVTLSQELSRLLIHGLLHLFLYDHENVPEEEAQRMFEKQEEILIRHELPPFTL
jgi:probable rRNA maturation factor